MRAGMTVRAAVPVERRGATSGSAGDTKVPAASSVVIQPSAASSA